MLRRSIMMLALATLAACVENTTSGAAPEPAQALRGTYWRLTEVGGRPATEGIAGREAHIRFDATGELMGGSTGCNSVSGAYRLEGDGLRFLEPITTTRMACSPPVGEQERAFIEALAASQRFALVGGRLVLYSGDRALMKFEAGTPR